VRGGDAKRWGVKEGRLMEGREGRKEMGRRGGRESY